MFRLILGLLLSPVLLFAQFESLSLTAEQSSAKLIEASKNLYAVQDVNMGYDFYNRNNRQFRIIVKNSTNWLQDLSNTPIHILMMQDAVNLSVSSKDDDYTKITLNYTNNHDINTLAKELSMIQGVWLVEVTTNKQS